MKECIHEIEEETPSKETPDADIIIVGAGVAGAALAYTLGKDGRRVHVIERDLSEPDRIVGEVLQPGGYLKLKELGLQDCVENIDAQRMTGYAIFKDGESAKLSYYPVEKGSDDPAGRSFHNGRFIQRMRCKAATLPTVELTEGTVTSLVEENDTVKGVEYKVKTGELIKVYKVYATLTIVCDGCFSNLRRSLCSPKVDILSSFVGLVLEKGRLPFPNHGHLILANPSPVLFYSIGSNEIRCLVDVPGKLPSVANGEMANYLKTVVAPQVPHELHDAFVFSIDNGNIRTMRNGSMPAAPCTKSGAIMVGDAFNMRHAVTGGGMTVALYDIVVLRNILRNSHDLRDTNIHRCFYSSRKPTAFTMNTMAGAVYKIACAKVGEGRKELQEAIFNYMIITGRFARGPVSLFSGLNLHPLNFLLQTTAAVVYGIGRLFFPFPNRERMRSVVRLTTGLWVILFPVLKREGVVEVLPFPRIQSLKSMWQRPKCN